MSDYFEKLLNLKGKEQVEFFLKLCDNPEKVQLDVLYDILKRNRDCEIGRKFSFPEISNLNEFRNNIPVRKWKDFSKFAKRMEQGEEGILFSGKTSYFTITSGTSGKDKLIPESEAGMLAQKAVVDLRNSQLLTLFPDIIKGKFLPLSNPAALGVTEGGIPFGAASGLTTKNISQAYHKLNACPDVAKKIQDLQFADYAIMRFAVAEDVRVITGNNAGRIPPLFEMAEEQAYDIISDIEHGTLRGIEKLPFELRKELEEILEPNPERAAELRDRLKKKGERFLPSLYWPNLRVIRCWLSGSVGRYTDQLKPWLDKSVQFMDGGYGASECKFNIPVNPGNASGPLAIFAAFFEFTPLDNDKEIFLTASELQDGCEYRIFITTYSGLYRYDIQDIIRVNGFTGKTPNIEFIAKSADIANLAGEKLSAKLITDAVMESSADLGVPIKHFGVVPNGKELRYIFYVEPAAELDSPEEFNKRFSETVDWSLSEKSIMYRVFRKQKLLEMPGCVIMPAGWQKSLYEEKQKQGLSVSQIKLPVIYDSI